MLSGFASTLPGIPWPDLLLRLGMAFFAGTVVGLERENHGRAAGLRTTALVSVAAAIAMILSGGLYSECQVSTGSWRPDPARLAAGVLAGMGFLGAGTIMREGRIVRGVTTAGALWFTTMLGLSFGAGYFALGIGGLGIAMLTLFVLPYIERMVHNDWYGSVSITLDMDGATDSQLKACIEGMGIVVKSVELSCDLPSRRRTFLCRIKYKNGEVFDLSERVVANLACCNGVVEVKWV